MAEPVTFDSTVEGLFVRGLARQMTPACKEKLRAAGLDLDQKLRSTYPLPKWKEFVRVAGRELFPALSPLEANRKLGELFMAGFFETMIGKTVRAVLKMLGPRRTVARSQQQYRAGNNFTETEVKELAPNHHQLWINDVFADDPGFMLGLIVPGLVAAGAREVEAKVLEFDGTACRFDLRWKE